MRNTARVLAAVALTLVVPRLAADASGTWAFSSDLLPPDLTCEFVAKDQTLSGTCTAVKTTLAMSDAQVTDQTLRWTINVPSDTGITTAYVFVGELDAQATSLKGSITIASVIGTEKGTFTAQRRQPSI